MSQSHASSGFIAPDPADLNALFPEYHIEHLIATGGMGAVYCAVQLSLDRTVALKILPQEFSADAAFCDGFEAEAKAMARLNHPNLIGVYDFGEKNGMLYIIMEYVAGQSLYHAAYGKAIAPAEVIRLVTAICHGLTHAHENGIIHRDIKPSNILLDLNGQPKIGDFGLARPSDRKVQEGEEIFGTPHYTAPEVVNAPHAVDHRADIFSVGVMLHELLTGKLPADDKRPPSVISRCDPRFDIVVRRATHYALAGRYSSASEMANDLAEISTSSPARMMRVPAGQAGPRVAAPLQPRRIVKVKKSSNSGTIIMVLLLIAMAVGVYAYYQRQQEAARSARPIAPVTTEAVSPAAAPVAPIEQSANSVVNPLTDPDPEPLAESGATRELSTLTTPSAPTPEVERSSTEVPDPQFPASPKFDVDGFFLRARGIMKDRAKSVIETHALELRSNIADFGKALKRGARKAEAERAALEDRIEKCLSSWNEEGRLPKELDSSLLDIPGSSESFGEFQRKQESLEMRFFESLSSFSSTYIIGLQKQIERLMNENDPAAIQLIEKEIKRTKIESAYFADMMEGRAASTAE